MKFTLRDLFWLVALVAMGCGWWANRSLLLMESNRIQEEAAKQREQTESDEYLIRVMRTELQGFACSVERDEHGSIHVRVGHDGYGRWLQRRGRAVDLEDGQLTEDVPQDVPDP